MKGVDSKHGVKALSDGTFFNARLRVRLFDGKKSSKKSVFATFENLLFLDTFCNTNVSDYRTGEFGLSAWTLSLLSYLEKSIYQNSRLKSRALSRVSENCCGGRLFRVHSTLPVGSVQLLVQHLRVKNSSKKLTHMHLRYVRIHLFSHPKSFPDTL